MGLRDASASKNTSDKSLNHDSMKIIAGSTVDAGRKKHLAINSKH